MTITPFISAVLAISISGPIAPAPVVENPVLTTDIVVEDMWEYRTEQNQEIIRAINSAGADQIEAQESAYLVAPLDLVVLDTIFLPVDSPEVSSDFGHRHKSCEACSSFHKGIDFTPGYGEPVYAITHGVVTDIGYNPNGYGRYIYLEHNIDGETFITLYAHLEQWTVSVEEGDEVLPGQQIGTVGNTGISTGPHLHFEVRDSLGEFLDPAEFFLHYAPGVPEL